METLILIVRIFSMIMAPFFAVTAIFGIMVIGSLIKDIIKDRKEK